MRNRNRSIIGVVAGVILIGAGCLFAQNWPQWRGANRDGKVTGFSVPKDWPKTLTQGWKVPVGTGDATPALVDGKLYVFTRQGDEEILRCLNAADGKEQWPYKYKAQAVTGAAARHPGPRSSPTVADGKVITLGVGGVLSCVDITNGHQVWQKDEFPKVTPQFFTAMSPMVVDGMCIAHLGGKDKGAVIAFNLTDGQKKWEWPGDGPAYASPVLMTVDGTKQVVIQTEKNLIGIAVADGKLLWQVPAVPQRRMWNSATPIVDKQTVIFTGQGQGTRAIKIEKKGDSFATKDLWTNDQVGTGYNTPVLKDGMLYGLSDRGNLFCMNAENGQTAWIDTTKHETFGAVVDAGPVLVTLPSKSDLVVFKPDAKAYVQVAKYKVADSEVYAHPVLSGKHIFVKDAESLTMWSVE